MAQTKRGRKPGASKVDPNETKAQKFLRIAPRRMTKVLNGIRQLGQLSAGGYESTPAQVQKMFQSIAEASEVAFNKFRSKGERKSEEGFKF